jgi:hypothetical protein
MSRSPPLTTTRSAASSLQWSLLNPSGKHDLQTGLYVFPRATSPHVQEGAGRPRREEQVTQALLPAATGCHHTIGAKHADRSSAMATLRMIVTIKFY